MLSGLDSETTRKCLNVVRESVSSFMREEYKSIEGKLGGVGKIIELDEMFAAKRKYNVGVFRQRAQ